MSNNNDNDSAVQWAGPVGSVTLSSNSARVASLAVAINADAVTASLRVLADNQGTPASGDTVDFWIAWSPDGANFDTEEHAQFLGRLDTFGTNDPGEDPAAKTFLLNVSGKQAYKLLSRGNQSATRNVVVSAIGNEHRMS